MEYKEIKLNIKERVAEITINRPPWNVLSNSTTQEFLNALDEIDRNEDVTVVVISGAGEKAFCAGVDVKDHTLDKVAHTLDLFHKIFKYLLNTDKVTIAKVRGLALGGGFELACGCDIVICTETSVFSQPEINLACFPPVGCVLLPDLIGYKKASELILTGEKLTAQQALQIGAVNQVVEDSLLDKTVDDLVKKITEKSSRVIKLTKMLLNRMRDSNAIFARIKDAEKFYVQELTKIEDAEEGIKSFIEKRKPVWKHR